MEISRSGLQSGNLADLLKLSWALNPDKLKKEFEKVGVEVSCEKDLELLQQINEKGIDVKGEIKDENDNPVMFDTIMIINSIPYSEEEKNSISTNQNVTFVK